MTPFRCIWALLLVGVLSLSASDVSAEQAPPALFSVVQQRPQKQTVSPPSIEVFQGSSLTPGVQSSQAATFHEENAPSTFTVPLAGRIFVGRPSRILSQNLSKNSFQTVEGVLLSGGDIEGTYRLTYAKGKSARGTYGSFELASGKRFGLRFDAQLEQLALQEIAPEAFPPCVAEDHSSDEDHSSTEHSSVGSDEPSGDQDLPVLRVLVAYTLEAREDAGGEEGIQALILNALASANEAYQVSETELELELAGTLLLTDALETTSFSTMLDRLTFADGIWDAVLSEREYVAADLVSLFVAGTNSCGIAWVMSRPGPDFEDRAFNVVSSSCAVGNFSFAHEIGHTLGSTHERGPNAGSRAYEYSYGYRFRGVSQTQWRTVMSYSPGIRIEHFSNPAVFYDGVPTGEDNYADNGRTFRETGPIVAAFRDTAVPRPTPTPTASITVTPTPTATPTPTPTTTPTPTVTPTPEPSPTFTPTAVPPTAVPTVVSEEVLTERISRVGRFRGWLVGEVLNSLNAPVSGARVAVYFKKEGNRRFRRARRMLQTNARGLFGVRRPPKGRFAFVLEGNNAPVFARVR